MLIQQNMNRDFLPQQQSPTNIRIIPQHQQHFQQQPSFPSFLSNTENNATNITFPTSNSVFSSLPPHSFTTTSKSQNHLSQQFHHSTFTQQQCPPPTMFDPFAAAVATNFMQHFTQNNHQQQVQSTPSAFFDTPQHNSFQSRVIQSSIGGIASSPFNCNFAFPVSFVYFFKLFLPF